MVRIALLRRRCPKTSETKYQSLMRTTSNLILARLLSIAAPSQLPRSTFSGLSSACALRHQNRFAPRIIGSQGSQQTLYIH
jgi:hypothetical protein